MEQRFFFDGKSLESIYGRMAFKKIASMLYDNSPCHVLPFEFMAQEGQAS